MNIGYIKIWDVATKRLINEFNAKFEMRSIDFHPDGTMIAVGGNINNHL